MAKSKLSTMNKKYAAKKSGRTKAAIAADKDRKAKHPGKRTSASGKTYFESRPNRSDVNRTKKFAKGGKVNVSLIGKPVSQYETNLSPYIKYVVYEYGEGQYVIEVKASGYPGTFMSNIFESKSAADKKAETLSKRHSDKGFDTKKFDDGGELGKITVHDEGVWADGNRGIYQGQRIIKLAEGRGFVVKPEDLENKTPDGEFYNELVDEAVEYLNEMAPEGYSFRNTEGGDFGLFKIDDEDEYAKGGQPKKPLSYYKYETPRITIYWKGKEQPLGRFKTAEDAFEVIKKQSAMNGDMDQYKIHTPDAILDLTKDGYFAKGGRTKAAIAADKDRKAMHPGKRTSASGKTYFESRPNRSDANRTKRFAKGGKVKEQEISLAEANEKFKDSGTISVPYNLHIRNDQERAIKNYVTLASKRAGKNLINATWRTNEEMTIISPEGSYVVKGVSEKQYDKFWAERDFQENEEFAGGGMTAVNDNGVKYVQEEFIIPGGEDGPEELMYKGWHNPEFNWNGFAVPSFDKRTTEKILKEGGYKYRVDEGKIFFVDPSYEEEGEVEIPSHVISVNGKKTTVYSVGDGWVWAVNRGEFAKGGRTKAAIAADKDRKAKHPGKRTSASGKTYFESRPNRSDANRTKRFAGGGKVKQVRVYSFDELSDQAKKKAISQFSDINVDYDWWDGVYDDAKNVDLNIRSFDLGRGRVITGDFVYSAENTFAKIKKEHGDQTETHRIAVEYFSEIDKVDQDADDADDKIEEINEEFKERLLGAYWRMLESEYEYLSSEESVIETIRANDYEFTEDGRQFTFKDGGKPLGSTGLFAKGGITRDSMSKVSARVPGNEEFKEGAIIIGVTKSGEILIANVFNGRYGGNKTPHFSVSGDTVQPYTLSAAKKYAKQFWIDLFEQDPDMLEDMNARMVRNFSSPSSAAQYVLDVDGELHGFDTYSKFGERSLLGKEYVFQHTGAGQNRDDFDNLSVKYVPDSYLNELLRLWDTYHLKELPASESIPFLSQDEDAILADAIKVISKRKFAEGGQAAEYDFEDWSKYNDQDLAHDIELFAENDSDLYRQSYVPIVKNLKKKLDKGTFDVKLAAKLWMYYVQSADKKYQKDVNGTTPKGFLLSVNDRKLLAERLAESILNEYNINKLDGFAKGGEVLEEEDINHLFAKVTDSGETMLDEFIDDNNGFGYESYYNKNTGEVEHKSVSGFIPFTNGGVSSTWFEYMSTLLGMGKRLPTNTLQKIMEDSQEQAYDFAKNEFKEKYPEIVEKIGEEKINYNDLYEEGFGSEAEELSEWETNYLSEEDTIMMQIGFYLYKPNNIEAIDKKPTCYVFGLVNMEAPYHREGNLEDYVDDKFTFQNEQGFKNKLAKALEKVKNWFEGGSYDQGKPLSIRRMRDGGSVADTSVQYADLPGDQFAKGGVARIANSEAKEHTENLIDFKGNNLEGKTLDNGDYVVLSYGYYPIWYYNKSEQKWYGNSTKYSVTTSKQMTQSRPTYDPVMLEHNQLLSKMQEENAKFDLGGAMIDVMYPMTLDNTSAAHAGSAIETQQQM